MSRSRRRFRMLGYALTVAGVMAWPGSARAADDARGRPWAKGTVVPSFGFGVGYTRDLVSLNFGLGASYYVFNGLSLGLQLDNEVLIFSKSLKSELPDIEGQIPTNVFRLTPVAQWVFLRLPRFSPYIFGGVGPAFFNNANGVFGHWTAGPGAYIGLAGPVFLDVGVGFSGMFPTDACNDRFVYQSEAGQAIPILDYCSFRWGPRLGLVLAFGTSSRARKDARDPAPDPFMSEPAPNLMLEAEPQAPASEVTPEPAADVSSGAPEDSNADAEVPSGPDSGLPDDPSPAPPASPAPPPSPESVSQPAPTQPAEGALSPPEPAAPPASPQR